MDNLKKARIRRSQISSSARVASLRADAPPRRGWIREVRKSLMMTGKQLAKRLGVDRTQVVRLEQAELSGKATLKSMRRAAEAMGCEFHYSFVPKQHLDDFLVEQAREKLKQDDESLAQTMALEGQTGELEGSAKSDIRLAMYLHEMGSRIWDE